MEIKTDGIVGKIIEFLREKASKKQIIAIVGLGVLFALKAEALYVLILTMYAITAQTVLDYIKEKCNVKENHSNPMSADEYFNRKL